MKIAVEAGVSIGSLYQFFGNKESVVSALIKQLIEDDGHFFFEKMKP
ncbi:MAG: TetR/AcrR family transcriptional regulator, partial [Cytophagaceae bacterium]